jgi:16S rRNA (cytidine1402-2'-O)-methyltransferase
MKGKLYLIPSTIGDTPLESVIPPYNLDIIQQIRCYIVENERTARRMLLKMGIKLPIDEIRFFVLNKYTKKSDLPEFIKIAEVEDIGLLSEAGVPAVADPGSEIVALAHQKNIEVVPLTGPSSILLALMASGLNGQNFAFVGYLPIQKSARINRVRELELRSQSENQSQVFIEAPYRNNQLLEDLLSACSPSTYLCIATEISTENAFINTSTIADWKKKKPDLNKRPTIFILHRLY